jgi:hypothetical protein
MRTFGLVCGVAYWIAALIVALRLLRLSRRTRELPELMIGLAFLTGSVIGYPAMLATEFLVAASSALAWPSAATGLIGVAVAPVFILGAWWKIYHPTRRWGPPVVCAWTALIAVVAVVELRLPAADLAALGSPWLPHRLVVGGGPFFVMAWSGFRYHARLRRRMRILLVDPVVANRILLWNLAASGVTLQCIFILAVPYLNPVFDAKAVQPAVYGTLGLIVALCITQAFYPSQAYLRKIRERAGSEVG